MNLSRAKYILTIVEEGSISAAARRLFVSQAALSQTVHYVEEEVGMPVLERGRGNVKLTYAGERYVATARRMLLLERSFRNEMDEIKREQSGQFRFGIPLHSGQFFLPEVMAEFRKAYPAVTFQVTEKGSADLVSMIREGELDLAVVRTRISDHTEQDLIFEILQEERMGILAGKGTGLYDRYLDGTEISLKDAEDESFVFMKKGHSSRSVQDRMLDESGVVLHPIVELDNFETARKVAARCKAVLIAPYSVVWREDWKEQDEIHFFPLKSADMGEWTCLLRHKSAYMTTYMKSWIELLKRIYDSKNYNA